MSGSMSDNSGKNLPETYRRWHLYGAGLENVGKSGEPETVPLQMPGANEILVRHDACGICYSDIKIINLGGEHPRLVGRDLARDPVVMGHEVSLTVVAVGEDLKERFHPGERYIVQADVYYQGRNLAYGYALTGGMSQYGLIGPEVLNGDEGCYLLPVQENTGHAEAALVEPWACVEAAYHWTHRSDFKPGGHVLVVGQAASAPLENLPVQPEPPRLETQNGKTLTYTFWNGLGDAPRVDGGFDDIIFPVAPDTSTFEAACAGLTKGGVVSLKLANGKPLSGPVKVDIGRVHYDGWAFVGTSDDKVSARGAYTANQRKDLRPGGVAWFIGAAGPMGQMHVQRALSLPEPPKRIVCTDRHDSRLATLRERFADTAAERGVDLLLYNVRTEGTPDLTTLAPDGFDDIVIMVPSIEAIEEAWPYVARDGILNVFAGVARGTMATLDISPVALKNARIVGTSGSTIEDMKTVRDVMESGQLDTGASLAAVGGLEAFRDGLDAVKSSRFPGKTVIFPHVADLPLTALPDLATVRPNVYAKLKDGKYWTHEAEEELLREEETE